MRLLMLGLDAAGKTSPWRSFLLLLNVLTLALCSDIVQVEVEPVCHDHSYR